MAKNDTILLDGIIDERIAEKLPSDRRDEVFEYLSFEQILKDYDLTDEEIESGAIDGRDDGGIDGFFIFVNGHLLQDTELFTWPRTGSEIEVCIITCKHHETFQQAPLDKLNASFYELLDFALTDQELKGGYSEAVLSKRSDLLLAYRKLSPRLQKLSINFVYSSRGDASIVGQAIRARAEQLLELTRANFSDCHAHFSFIGASELVSLHRKRPNFSLELPFVELLSRGENYILLSKLREYYEFVSDNGKLRRYLFDSNVRDFMGLNPVNEDIKGTLVDNESPDFWWLNNGVTILASGASVIGKSIKLTDIQIVNGLQTTESIHRHFRNGLHDHANRAVLVKVIVSNNETVRDAIIRSTNNQTYVELSSLHATDKIQRDIEEVMVREGLYYERRKNYYTNLGHKPSEIITPIYIAAGFLAVIKRNPQRAVRLKSRFMRSEPAYKSVFSDETPIAVWPLLGHLLKKVDQGLENTRPDKPVGEYFLKNWRYITAFCLVSKLLGTFNYTFQQFLSLTVDEILVEEVEEVVGVIWAARDLQLSNNKQWNKEASVGNACRAISEKYGVEGLDDWFRYGRLHLLESSYEDKRQQKNGSLTKKPTNISQEFIYKVDKLLPEQPWKPGIQVEIIEHLGCSKGEYFQATKKLIEQGKRYNQKDGVLYDRNGDVVSFDPERVDPDTLQLKD